MATVHALLIGIDHYPSENGIPLPSLLGSVNDTLAVKDFLQDRFGDDLRALVRTAPLPGSSGDTPCQPLPDLSTIRSDLARLAGQARSGDQIVVYFSGHGLRLPTERPHSPGSKLDECLALFPTSASMKTSVLRDFEIAKWCRTLSTSGALVTWIVDSCHSGGTSKVLEGAEPSRAVHCQNLWLPENPVGLVFLAACQPHQKAHQKVIGSKVRGYMTHCLLELLRSSDPESNWDVVYHHLVAAVRKEIGHQTPHLEGERFRQALGWSEGPKTIVAPRPRFEPTRTLWAAAPSLPRLLEEYLLESTIQNDLLLPVSRAPGETADLVLHSLETDRVCFRSSRGEDLLDLGPSPEKVREALEHLAHFRYVQYLDNPSSTLWRALHLTIHRADGRTEALTRRVESTDPPAFAVSLQPAEAPDLVLRNPMNRVVYFTLFSLSADWEIVQAYPEDSWASVLESGCEERIQIELERSEGAEKGQELLFAFVTTAACDLRALELPHWNPTHQRGYRTGFAALRHRLETATTKPRGLTEGSFWDWTVEKISLRLEEGL